MVANFSFFTDMKYTNIIIHHNDYHRSSNLVQSQVLNVVPSSEMDHARDENYNKVIEYKLKT